MVMSIARMGAGNGFEYMLRNTARGDGAQLAVGGDGLIDYYLASGYPPGAWIGNGLAGLGHGAGLEHGSIVVERQMARLFGHGHDPVTDTPLGKSYAETGKGRARGAVAGFDLTFSVPKSVSVLWALGDRQLQHAIATAHHDAITQTLAVAEHEVFRTRLGAGGTIAAPTRGVIAAAFDHYDSRAGDPQLHTHVTVANRVQGPDGAWRTLYSRRLHQAVVSMSEMYDGLLADHLTRSLGLTWEWRQRGSQRNPARELVAVPENLIRHFSQRATAIGTAKEEAIARFVAKHGRQPTDTEMLKIRQRATLTTRTAKHTRSLAEHQAEWRDRASRLLGTDAASWAADAVTGTARAVPPTLLRAEQIPDGDAGFLARATLAAVESKRSTWSRWNLRAEACRQIAAAGLQFATPVDLLLARDRVVDEAVSSCIRLNPADGRDDSLSLSPGAGPAQAEMFTSETILGAEDRLLAAADDLTGPRAPDAATAAIGGAVERGSRPPDETQQRVIDAICASGRMCDVLVGPAGSGKSTTMAGLTAAWQARFGDGAVVGLAPSAEAARVLGGEIGASAETTAQWIAQQAAQPGRRARLADLQAVRERLASTGRDVAALDAEIARAASDLGRWQLRAGQLVIVDEAGMADTRSLDTLITAARKAGAKVLLVGDPDQLPAVGTGGAFRLLTETRPDAPALMRIQRFRNADGSVREWEAAASADLRRGLVAAIDRYSAEGRVHAATDRDGAIDSAHRAWSADIASGKNSLLLAADNATVTELNRRAQRTRIAAGTVDVGRGQVDLADGTCAAIGDAIVTRKVDRTLADGTRPEVRRRNGTLAEGFVTNGGRFTVEKLTAAGGLVVRADRGRLVELPADYVARHVQLGYAVTAHRAQGSTVDTAHVVAAPGMMREAFYVGMTRGREANHAHVAADAGERGDIDRLGPALDRSAEQVLRTILDSRGAEQAARQLLRAAGREAAGTARPEPGRVPVNAGLTAASRRRTYSTLTRGQGWGRSR